MPVTLVKILEYDSEDKKEQQNRRKMGQTPSKWDQFFKRKNLVNDISEDKVKEVPGNLGLTLFNVLGLVKSGHHFYQNKRDSYNSDIYKVCIYKPRIVLCSHDGIRHLYESTDVCKEPSFGMFTFNHQVLGGYTPLIFENKQVHDKRRNVFICLTKKLFCNELFIENTSNCVEGELQESVRLIREDPSNDFEDLLAGAVSNVVSQSLIGTRLDHALLKRWMENCLIKKFKKAQPEAKIIYQQLKDAISASEIFKEFVEQATKEHELVEDEICHEIMFSLVFNAYKALHGFVVSAVAHLSNLSKEDLDLLRSEASAFHQSNDKAAELTKLENIENYTLEIFRLFPPACFVFRRAKNNFVIALNSGNFQINQDDYLCGNIYLSQRDPNLFDNPDSLDFHRFKKQPKLRDYLMCFGASFSQQSRPDLHKCAGQRIALTLAKMFVIHSLSLRIEYNGKPFWSGKRIKRIIGSDKPLKIKTIRWESL